VQGVEDDGDGGKAHRCAGDHGVEEDAEDGVEDARRKPSLGQHPTPWIAIILWDLLLPALYRNLPDASRRMLLVLMIQLFALLFCGEIDEARI
jgi:hypothetical protein